MKEENCLNCESYRSTQTYSYCEATQRMLPIIVFCDDHKLVNENKTGEFDRFGRLIRNSVRYEALYG